MTPKEEDNFVFKVPMLHNVTLTSPVFNDGCIADLSGAVGLVAHIQLSVRLSPTEIDEIVRFLQALKLERSTVLKES